VRALCGRPSSATYATRVGSVVLAEALRRRAPWLLPVSGAAFTCGAGYADRERSGRREIEGIEVDVGHAPVEADGFVCERD
jgi:hypothetical protein